MILDSDCWYEILLKTQGKIMTLLAFGWRSSQLVKQFLNMLRSVESGIGSPSLLIGLSPETGKAKNGECDGAGWNGFTPSQCCNVSHQCRHERICELSIVLLSLMPLLLPASLPWQGCLMVVFRRQNSILLTLLRSLSQTSNLLQLCLQKG